MRILIHINRIPHCICPNMSFKATIIALLMTILFWWILHRSFLNPLPFIKGFPIYSKFLDFSSYLQFYPQLSFSKLPLYLTVKLPNALALRTCDRYDLLDSGYRDEFSSLHRKISELHYDLDKIVISFSFPFVSLINLERWNSSKAVLGVQSDHACFYMLGIRFSFNWELLDSNNIHNRCDRNLNF